MKRKLLSLFLVLALALSLVPPAYASCQHEFGFDWGYDENGHWGLCENCGEAMSAETLMADEMANAIIDELGYVYAGVITDSWAYAHQLNGGACVLCGYQACAHEYGAWVVTKAPGCAWQYGQETSTCAKCGDEKYNLLSGDPEKCVFPEESYPCKAYACINCGMIPKEEELLDHEVVVDAGVEPTATASGKTEGSHCGVCGTVLVAQEIIPPTGLDMDETVAIDEVNFPDKVFQSIVSSEYDKDKDGYLSQQEIDTITVVDVTNEEISSLVGIEHFTKLKRLECDSNQLTSLDVSNCTELTSLDCADNRLTGLDVSNNAELTRLYCYSNQLTSLDVSNRTELTYLDCGDNQLTSLDVSNNAELEQLFCYSNQLTSLDVSNCTELTYLNCRDNQLTSLDVSNNAELTYLNCGNNQLTSLDVSGCTALTALSCYNNYYELPMDISFTFDLSALPGFDVSKASGWKNGSVAGTILTADSGVKNVSYTYDCGNEMTASFTLVINRQEHEHSYSAAVTAPTCTEQGYTTYTCACGDSYKDSYTEAKGHNYGLIETKEPTATEAGYEKYDCERCGDIKEIVLPATGGEPELPTFTDVDPGKWYAEPVAWAVSEDITSGTSANTFGPNDSCARAQVVMFLWAANGRPAPTSTTNPFTDIQTSKYYYNAVLWAVEKGITGGAGNGTFAPDRVVTRAEFVTMLWNALEKPSVSIENPFPDVVAGKWYATPVLWAYANGITSGMKDGTFGVSEPCTRAQVVTFLYSAYGK